MIAGPTHNCGNCGHWREMQFQCKPREFGDSRMGECHGGPPTAIPVPFQTLAGQMVLPLAAWPVVAEGDSCGRYRPIPIVTSPTEASR